MSGKRPAKKGTPTKSEPVVAFKFGDGTQTLSAIEVERQLQRQYHAMANSDHPELRTRGRQRLLEVAKRAVRDSARQAGTRKSPRPEINEWIAKQLKYEPSAKAPELWGRAPGWLTDQIGPERFRKRVTDVRKGRR